jgi:hypothetical protein
MSKRYGYLIDQIIEYGNMSEAFDEVVGGLRNKERKAYYEAKRSRVIADLQALIVAGRFRVESYTEFEVKEGPKIRKVQSPSVKDRIGCNAIMRVVERYVYPMVIRTSAASIKGRGMHRLYRKVRTDIRHDKEGTRYYYKCDIRKFYQSIDQKVMWGVVLEYIKDPILLPMLKNLVEMMPEGLSIGLRSSQCFGNLLLARIDHLMKEKYHVRYYYRYCDDIVMMAATKRELWRLRNILHREVEALGLVIKPDEAIRPITEGLDFLGYVDDGSHTRLRKRTKQKAARKLAKVKSRKRRQEIIGSLKGMAKWGDCNNMYYKLTGRRMKSFKELGLQYVAEDGKKRFGGKQVTLRSLQNVHIKIVDFETEVPTENGLRTVVSFEYDNGDTGKYFTADKQQLWYLEKIREMDEFPFDTTIGSEVFGNGKVRYLFT